MWWNSRVSFRFTSMLSGRYSKVPISVREMFLVLNDLAGG